MTRLSLTNPSSSSIDEQIRFEKRRRNQAYKALDYILARVSYFDFFSSNAFTLALYSKYFTQLYTKKIVTSEYTNLTHAFFDGPEIGFVNAILDKISHNL